MLRIPDVLKHSQVKHLAIFSVNLQLFGAFVLLRDRIPSLRYVDRIDGCMLRGPIYPLLLLIAIDLREGIFELLRCRLVCVDEQPQHLRMQRQSPERLVTAARRDLRIVQLSCKGLDLNFQLLKVRSQGWDLILVLILCYLQENLRPLHESPLAREPVLRRELELPV